MARKANPRIQSTPMFGRVSRGKTSDDYLKQLEELTKLNRGGFSTTADDTEADTGFIVPGGMYSKNLGTAPDVGANRQAFNVTPPSYRSAPEFPQYQDKMSQSMDTFDQRDFEQRDQTFSVDQPVQPNEVYSGTGVLNFFSLFPQAAQFNAGNDSLIGECAWFSEQITTLDGSSWRVGNTIQEKKSAFETYLSRGQAIEPGYGAANVGNSIIFDVGTNWGHVATISEVFQGADGEYYYRLTESNFAAPKTVTHDRVVAYNDPQIVGILSTQPRDNYTLVTPEEAPPVQGTRTLAVENNATNGQQERFFNDTPEDLVFQGQEPTPAPDVTNPREPAAEPSTEATNNGLITNLQSVRDAGGSLLDAASSVYNQAGAALEPMSPERQQVGSGINTTGLGLYNAGIGRNLGNDPAGWLGAGELAAGDINAARQEQAATVNRINPTGDYLDFGITEDWQGDRDLANQKRQQTYQNISNDASKLTSPDTFVQGVGSIGQGLTDYAKRKVNDLTPDVYAADFNPAMTVRKSIEENVPETGVDLGVSEAATGHWAGSKAVRDDTLGRIGAKAGEGIDRLKGLFSNRTKGNNLGELTTPANFPDIGIGQSGGGSLLPAPTVAQSSAQLRNDTTDPFFKSDVFNKLKGFTNFSGGQPGKDQALSMDVFNDQFYDSPERAASVFQSTYMQDPALSRATENVKNAYRQKYSGEDYDQADVERIINQLPANLAYTPNLPEPNKKPKQKPMLDDYLRAGKTAAQYYAETGQQSSVDAAGGADNLRNRNASAGSQSVTYPSGRTVNASPGYELRRDSSGSVQQVRSGDIKIPGTNYVADLEEEPSNSPSAQINKTGSSSTSLFDRAKNFAGGLFNRFFN